MFVDLGKMIPECLGLEVVENASDATLKGFYFQAEWLLEVKEIAR